MPLPVDFSVAKLSTSCLRIADKKYQWDLQLQQGRQRQPSDCRKRPRCRANENLPAKDYLALREQRAY